MESQYIFNDGKIKSRLKKILPNWFVVEWKKINTEDKWFPALCGTKEFLGLTKQEIDWAK